MCMLYVCVHMPDTRQHIYLPSAGRTLKDKLTGWAGSVCWLPPRMPRPGHQCLCTESLQSAAPTRQHHSYQETGANQMFLKYMTVLVNATFKIGLSLNISEHLTKQSQILDCIIYCLTLYVIGYILQSWSYNESHEWNFRFVGHILLNSGRRTNTEEEWNCYLKCKMHITH